MRENVQGALGVLTRDVRIDRDCIAVLGFSRGGMRPCTRRSNGERFALQLAYDPWCVLRLHEPVTTRGPIDVHMGADDTVTPPPLCRRTLAELQRSNDTQVRLHAYPRTGHVRSLTAADPRLDPQQRLSTRDCVIRKRPDRTFIPDGFGIEVDDRGSLQDAFKAGGGDEAFALANGEAAERAWDASPAQLRCSRHSAA